MKTLPSRAAQAVAADSSAPQPKRRQLVVGAGVAAGAAFAAAAALRSAETPAAVAEAKPDAATPQGYRLTEHVRRYYETTRS
jgi:NAD(P)H-hydrate repair Nnr-like enzyme with NAD(P)H-hydrate epimerase domain